MLRIQIPDIEENVAEDVSVMPDNVDTKNNVALALSVICFIAAIALFGVFLNYTSASAHATEETIPSSLGPFDMLGQKLMTSSADDDLYVFDVVEQPNEAAVLTADIEPAEPDSVSEPPSDLPNEIGIQAAEELVSVPETELPVVFGDGQDDIENVAVPSFEQQVEQVFDITEQAPVVENIQPTATQPAVPSIADLQRQAEEQIIAQSRERQVKANAESDMSRRIAVQQAQAAEAKLKAQADADYLYSLTHPQHRRFYSSIAIAGEVVKWIPDVEETPEDLAGAWVGTGDVSDGKGTYFIGHNPGVFHMLIDSNVSRGDVISVWDVNGYARAYTVDDVFVIEAGAVFDLEMQKRTVYSGGECIALQTCVDDGKRYKVFVAH